MESSRQNPFVRRFDLDAARRYVSTARSPHAHQEQALKKLHAWFEPAASEPARRGGLLVLPTGGGKTFTAVRFLSEWPLSEGYKVLWLAHTHHLLEQAFETFGPATFSPGARVEVSKIREPREKLDVRVVSGMPGHAKVHSISPDDDVVIGSLQTIAAAHRDDHESLFAFLRAAGQKLFVVFDEAHHAPAPSYARFVNALCEQVPGLPVLGLTATPVYENKLRRGWLARLFPQGIIYQTTANALMAAKVLARPIPSEVRTHIDGPVDERKLARWSESFADLPSDIVSKLAESQARNDVIVKHYVDNREKFGKTLIFADRWAQCEYLARSLQAHGVRADVVYSKVDAAEATVEQRNRRTADDNTKAIRAFKNNEIDVLVNVRMLTEGTDVPDIQTVFLTRQTTSRVLLTQMVGRALRGPASGGTAQAHVVSFIDEWKQLVNWAEFTLDDGATDDHDSDQRRRLPVQLVSIELVRKLVAQMYDPASEAPATFLEMLPVGWYRVELDAQVADSEDIEHLDRLVLVYDVEQASFTRLLEVLEKEDLSELADPLVTLDSQRARVEGWIEACFTGTDRLGGNLAGDVLHIARHVAQSGDRPQFFPFEEREKHDLDALAREIYDADIGVRQVAPRVRHEYERPDRFWRSLYGSPDLFHRHFDMVLRRIADEAERGGQPAPLPPGEIGASAGAYVDREPPEHIKRNVKERDGWKCLCCGATDKRNLEVDHIVAVHHGGKNELANLQTLCKRCNGDKGVNELSFLRTETVRRTAHPDFAPRLLPTRAGESSEWERCVRATVNHYYRCAAVSHVEIGRRGARFYEWLITLNAHNDPRFLEQHLAAFLDRIRAERSQARFQGPDALLVEGLDATGRPWSTRAALGEGTTSIEQAR